MMSEPYVSCCLNAIFRWDKDTFSGEIRALRPISEGEEVTIAWFQVILDWHGNGRASKIPLGSVQLQMHVSDLFATFESSCSERLGKTGDHNVGDGYRRVLSRNGVRLDNAWGE
jgi:hypothetical protein